MCRKEFTAHPFQISINIFSYIKIRTETSSFKLHVYGMQSSNNLNIVI